MPAEPRIPGDVGPYVDYLRGLTAHDEPRTFTGQGEFAGLVITGNTQQIAEGIAAYWNARHAEPLPGSDITIIEPPPSSANDPISTPPPFDPGPAEDPFDTEDATPNAPITAGGFPLPMGGFYGYPVASTLPAPIRKPLPNPLEGPARVERERARRQAQREIERDAEKYPRGSTRARRLGKRAAKIPVIGDAVAIGAIILEAFGATELGSGELADAVLIDSDIDVILPEIKVPKHEQLPRIPDPKAIRERGDELMREAAKEDRDAAKEAERIRSVGPPSPSGPAPAPGSQKGQAVKFRLKQLLGQLFGGGTGLLRLLDVQRAPRTTTVVNLPSAGVVAPPLTAIEPALLPSAASFPLPSSLNFAPQAPSHACSCKVKKRGERRVCRSRAAVKWAGGPRKGQLAGKRCISWER